MSVARALLFDLNGTMVNDMSYHVTAWHNILNRVGARISLSEMKQECYGKNSELIERICPGRFTEEEKNRMNIEKEEQYQLLFKPNLRLIEGLEGFLVAARRAGVKLAIGSAAITPNINFVLDGLNIRKYFHAVVSADDVSISKPDPETWITCTKLLGLSPWECLVFEDSPKGAESAQNAGIKCIIVTDMHAREEFARYANVVAFIRDFRQISIDDFL